MDNREYLDMQGLQTLVSKIKNYVDSSFEKQDAMQYQGTYTLQTSSGSIVAANFSGTSPKDKQYAKGWTYKITANGSAKKGYFGDVKVEVGDMIIVNNNEKISLVNSSFDVIQTNLDGVVTQDATKAMTIGNLVQWMSDGTVTDSGISAEDLSGTMAIVNQLVNGLLSAYLNNQIAINRLLYLDANGVLVSSNHHIDNDKIVAGTESHPADIMAYGGIAAMGIVDPDRIQGVSMLAQLEDVDVQGARMGYILAFNTFSGKWEAVANNPASIREENVVSDGQTVVRTIWQAGDKEVSFTPIPSNTISKWFDDPSAMG